MQHGGLKQQRRERPQGAAEGAGYKQGTLLEAAMKRRLF
jgi:hypothetical protein